MPNADQRRRAVAGIAEFLGIRSGEFYAVAWSFAYFFCIFSAYAMLRPIRDAMVVVSGVSTIPWLFTGTLTVMLIVTPIFGWVASRFPRKQFLPWVYYFFIANILFFYALFTYAEYRELDDVWIGRSFFVWLSVFNLFVVAIFWSFMADVFSKEQSRRLFGVISAGGSTGGLVGPFATGMLVVPIGFRNVLPLSALLLLGAVFCIYRLRKWVRQHGENSDRNTVESSQAIGGNALEGIRLVFTTPYFAAIAFALAMATFTGVVAYTYMQELAGIAFADTDRRTQVFSWMDFTINALSFIGQLILVKHSVKKMGIGATLALLPIVSILGFALLAVHPVFAIMAGLNIVRRSLAFGFSKPTSDMLYAVVTAEEKYKVKNFVETAIYRSGDALAAWTIVLSGIGISAIAIVCIPIAAVWAAMSFFIGREYDRRADSTLSPESA